jgi:hypothetical protein
MNDWVKNIVMLTALTAWAAYVGLSLIRGEQVEAVLWGVPGAIYFALNPSIPRRDKDDK